MFKSIRFIVALLLTFIISLSSIEAQTSKTQSVFSNPEILEIENIISTKNLNQSYLSGGVDKAKKTYSIALNKILKKTQKLKPDSNGFKFLSDSDRKLLVQVVESTQYFSTRIDGGLAHWFYFLKLKDAAPRDLNSAIQSSNLSELDKTVMKETLNDSQGE